MILSQIGSSFSRKSGHFVEAVYERGEEQELALLAFIMFVVVIGAFGYNQDMGNTFGSGHRLHFID